MGSPRIVYPTWTDWQQSADFHSGTVLIHGQLARIVHNDLWRGAVGAYRPADPTPWDWSLHRRHGARDVGVQDGPDRWVFSDTYIDHGNVLSMGLSDWAVSCWFRTSAAQPLELGAERATFLGKGAHANSNGYALMLVDNTVRFQFRNGPTVVQGQTTETYQDNAWHCAVGCIDRDSPTGLNLYVDGVLRDTRDATSLSASSIGVPTLSFMIGATEVPGTLIERRYIGSLKDVHVWNRILDWNEIVLLSQRPDIAYECRLI